MKLRAIAPIALLSALSALALQASAGPFDAFRGKMKEGQWEMTIKSGPMSGEGLPAGFTPPPITMQHCVTAKDLEEGGKMFGGRGKEGKMPEGCDVKNMKVAGDRATYTVECTKNPKMVMENEINFTSSGYTMKQNGTMDAGGRQMNMSSTIEGKYLGACK